MQVLFFATISSAAVGAIVGAFVYGRLGAITAGVAGAGTGRLRGTTMAVPLSAFAFYGTGITFGIGVGLVALLARAWGLRPPHRGPSRWSVTLLSAVASLAEPDRRTHARPGLLGQGP